jgi:hypothetical protein
VRSIQFPIQLVLETASLGLKRQERQADRPPLSSAEVRNGGAILPPLNTSSFYFTLFRRVDGLPSSVYTYSARWCKGQRILAVGKVEGQWPVVYELRLSQL